jgi:hypothetical protein
MNCWGPPPRFGAARACLKTPFLCIFNKIRLFFSLLQNIASSCFQ